MADHTESARRRQYLELEGQVSPKPTGDFLRFRSSSHPDQRPEKCHLPLFSYDRLSKEFFLCPRCRLRDVRRTRFRARSGAEGVSAQLACRRIRHAAMLAEEVGNIHSITIPSGPTAWCGRFTQIRRQQRWARATAEPATAERPPAAQSGARCRAPRPMRGCRLVSTRPVLQQVEAARVSGTPPCAHTAHPATPARCQRHAAEAAGGGAASFGIAANHAVTTPSPSTQQHNPQTRRQSALCALRGRRRRRRRRCRRRCSVSV